MPAFAQATSHSEPGEWAGSLTSLFGCFSCLDMDSSTCGSRKLEPEWLGPLSYFPLCIHLASALIFFSISFLPTQQEPHEHMLAAVSCSWTSVQGSRLQVVTHTGTHLPFLLCLRFIHGSPVEQVGAHIAAVPAEGW